MSEERKQLMCLNVEDAGFHYEGVDGSTKSRCGRCNEPVWVSPSGITMLANGDMDIICNRCLQKAMEEENSDDPIQFMPPQPLQIKEIIEQLSVDAERKANGTSEEVVSEALERFYSKVFGMRK